MRSIPSYFRHIADKTYIDKYPSTIIDLDRLKKGILIEFGSGSGNDLLWLFQQGMPPENMCSFELDIAAYRIQSYMLHEKLGIYAFLHLPLDAIDSGFTSEIADFVYANNMLHCLEDRGGITAVVTEAHKLLVPKGVFFGRTLSNEIDTKRLESIENPQDDNQRFALQTARALQEGVLVGLPPQELEDMARSVGFSEVYTELKEHPWKPTTDFYFRFVR